MLWTKEIPTAPEDADGDDAEGITYCDLGGKVLPCETVDALRAGVRFARRYAKEFDEPVWSEGVLEKATIAVMSEFGEELRALGLVVEEEE